jgi:hypothetical protein
MTRCRVRRVAWWALLACLVPLAALFLAGCSKQEESSSPPGSTYYNGPRVPKSGGKGAGQ